MVDILGVEIHVKQEKGGESVSFFFFLISFRLALDNISKQAKCEFDTLLLLFLQSPSVLSDALSPLSQHSYFEEDKRISLLSFPKCPLPPVNYFYSLKLIQH